MDALDQVSIAKPCSASWNEMEGDDRKRFCNQCRLHVYNVENMDRSEALTLLTQGNKVCLRLYQRHDGTVITRDCPVGVTKVVRRRSTVGVMVASACLSGLAFVARGAQPNGDSGTGTGYASKLASWFESAQARLTATPPPPPDPRYNTGASN